MPIRRYEGSGTSLRGIRTPARDADICRKAQSALTSDLGPAFTHGETTSFYLVQFATAVLYLLQVNSRPSGAVREILSSEKHQRACR